MKTFESYLLTIEDIVARERMKEILDWVANSYPSMEKKIAWKQPMFLDHGTYIIGFSISKAHISVSPEEVGITHFKDEIKASNYSASKMLFRIKHSDPINYELLKKIIDYNRIDKKDCTSFWRK